MKKKITEENASAMVLDAIVKQTEKSWDELWLTLQELQNRQGEPLRDKDFAKFNFLLAAIALNMRSGFDVYEKHQAERLMTNMVRILEKLFGQGEKFETVRASIMKYMEAYNQGIYNIRNPVIDIAMAMWNMMDMENMILHITGQAGNRQISQPTLQFLTNSLVLFSGKWELLNKNFVMQSQTPSGRAPGVK
jgi:hypothetical protein